MKLLGRVLLIAWCIVISDLFLSGSSPTFLARMLHPELIRYALLPLILLSAIYGLRWVYRQGMKSARHN